MAMMTRAEHMRWCKARALEYIEAGSVKDAIASMLSDLHKHPETAGLVKALGPLGLSYAMTDDLDGARRFIEGFTE